MRFAFSTLYMTVLTSNVLILLIYMIFRKKELLLTIGYQILGIFLFITVLRFLFPFELPVTTNLPLPEFLSKIIANFVHPRFTLWSLHFSIFNIFEFLWLLGILILVYHTGRNYIKLCDCIISTSSPISNEEECMKIIDRICQKHQKNTNVRVLTGPAITVPIVCYWKGYCIFLPDVPYTQRELYYILSHEMTHIFSHDLFLKLGIQILCIFYWWNPFCYLLKKQCNILLEMRVDQTLTNGRHDTKVSYLKCLFHVVERSAQESAVDLGISFCRGNTSELLQRYSMLMEAPQPKRASHIFRFLTLVVVGMLYLGSFFYIFEARYVIDPIEESVINVTPENMKIIDNENGTYSVYLNGIFIETTDSLEYYPDTLPIHKRERNE